MQKEALIVGISGVIGRALAQKVDAGGLEGLRSVARAWRGAGRLHPPDRRFDGFAGSQKGHSLV